MTTFIKLYLISIVIFFVIDILWLGLLAKDLYQKEMGHLLKSNVNWVTAVIFYLIFIAGLTLFVTMPGLESGNLLKIVIMGALFGLVTYATYDLTNFATMEGFPFKMVIIDLVWGIFIATITSTLTYLIYQGVFNK